VQAGLRPRKALHVPGDAGDQVVLQVVELELRRLTDDLDRARPVEHARQLDADLVLALLAHLGLGDAELVDPVADDLDRAVEIRLGQLVVAALRLSLEHDLDSAL
jgi:hypothetical protein